MSAADKAEKKATEVKTSLAQRLEAQGIVNPAGLAFVGFGATFLAAVPVVTWLAQPGGLLQRGVNGLVSSIVYLGSAGATSQVAQTGKIAALSTLYIAFTFGLSGANSVAGQAAAHKGGRDNNHPRTQTASLTGLPLRLYSAHYNLVEMFGGYALSAALTQAVAPADQTLINLLGLHVIAKLFVYYPAYLFNVDAPRSLAHVTATGSVIAVALRLARLPLV